MGRAGDVAVLSVVTISASPAPEEKLSGFEVRAD